MGRYEFGYDMDPNIPSDFPGVSPETWSGASGADVVQSLRDRVPPEDLPLLGENPSLQWLAHLAGPPELPPRVRARLEQSNPDLLERIDKTARDK